MSNSIASFISEIYLPQQEYFEIQQARFDTIDIKILEIHKGF